MAFSNFRTIDKHTNIRAQMSDLGLEEFKELYVHPLIHNHSYGNFFVVSHQPGDVRIYSVLEVRKGKVENQTTVETRDEAHEKAEDLHVEYRACRCNGNVCRKCMRDSMCDCGRSIRRPDGDICNTCYVLRNEIMKFCCSRARSIVTIQWKFRDNWDVTLVRAAVIALIIEGRLEAHGRPSGQVRKQRYLAAHKKDFSAGFNTSLGEQLSKRT